MDPMGYNLDVFFYFSFLVSFTLYLDGDHHLQDSAFPNKHPTQPPKIPRDRLALLGDVCNCGYKNHTEQDCCADGLVCSSDGPNEFYRCKLGLGETCKVTSDCASHIYHRTVECRELVNGPGLFECCIPAVGLQAGFSCKIGFKKSKYLQAIVVLWALEPRHRTDVCKTNLKHTIWEVFFRCFQVRRS